MKKRVLAVTILLTFLLSFTVTAAEPFKLGYGIGDSTFTVSCMECIVSDEAIVSDGKVVIPKNKSVSFGFYLPFDAVGVTIKYANASGKTVIDFGTAEYSVSLSGSGEYKLNFGENLGYDNQNFYYTGEYTYFERSFTERCGERTVTVKSENGISIESLVFEREKIPVPYDETTGNRIDYVAPDVSDEIMKTLSTVMIDIKSPVIYVNGSRRYVDNNDIEAIPFNNNGTLYLPINTVAKAFGYYCESIPNKVYALMRNETYEYVLNNGVATLSINGADEKNVTEPAIIYKNGQPWAAVRYFAELKGDTVGYKDGLAVIDNKYTVENILSDNVMYEWAESIFDDFKAEKKKGTTYYVAQTENADDANSGTAAAPFKTLAKAAETAKAGDTVIIKEGIYRETLKPKNNGTAANPIIFQAADGEKVLISALEELGKLALYENNIYTAAMDWDMGGGKNQIFVNGTSMTEARYPNEPKWRNDLSDLWPTKGELLADSNDSTLIKSDTMLNQNEADYWKGGYYVGTFGYAYALATGIIRESANGSLSIGERSEKWWWNAKDDDLWNYGCIIGHMNALDTENEWAKQGDNVYMILPSGVDFTTAYAEAKARNLVIDLSNKKFINIEGIETIGGSITMNNSEMCMLNNADMRYITHYTLSNDQRDGYIDIPFNLRNENGAPQRGEVGIYLGGRDNIIVNSRIDHSAGAGVYATGLYAYIENNVLNDCGYMGSYVSGINFNTCGTDSRNTPRGGHAVFNNTVYNCGRSCLNIGQIEGIGHLLAPYLPMEIAYNDFHDGMVCTLDTGIIYAYYVNLGINNHKTMVHHNYIYSTQSKEEENPHAFGIYYDGGSCGTLTYGNLVFNTDENADFSEYSIFQQPLLRSPAYHDVYNNRTFDAGIGSSEPKDDNLFPQGKAYYAGANPYLEMNAVNYEKINNDECISFSAQNAVLSDGVVLENAIARFTAPEQYLCFENMDFGSGSDILNLTVFGDKNHTYDEIEVSVGNAIDEGTAKKFVVQVNSAAPDKPDNINLNIGCVVGVKNVYVKMKSLKSLGIGGAFVGKLSERGKTDIAYSAKAFAADYTSCIAGKVTAPPESVKYSNGKYTDRYVKNTYGGTSFTYEKMRFNKSADSFVIAVGCDGENSGQTITVYVDGELSASCTVEKNGWFDFTPVTIPATRKISAGIHTVRIEFGNASKTSNFYYFGFIPDGTEIK